VKANCFKLLRKNSGMNNSGGTQNGQNGLGGMAGVVLSSMTKIEDLAMIFGLVTVLPLLQQ
jgi:hypothetical protein